MAWGPVNTGGVVSSATSGGAGSVVEITFDSEFIGQQYVVTDGEFETKTGVVPSSGVVTTTVTGCSTTYSVAATSKTDGLRDFTTFTTEVHYSKLTVSLVPFRATLNITTAAGAVVTATQGVMSFTGTVDASGHAQITVRGAGDYAINASKGALVSESKTIANTTNGGNHSATVNFTIADTPSPIGLLVYSGSPLSPTWSGYEENQLTIGGTTSAPNAGTYSATFTPKTGYIWSNNTTETRTVNWCIDKTTGSLTLNKNSMHLSASTQSETITVTRPGDGTITVQSNNETVATASVSGTTVTVTAKGDGSATITINVAEGTNHLAPSSKTCAVSVSGMTVNAIPTQSGSLDYTGNSQTPTWDGFNTTMLDISGSTSGTNAGTYNVTFTPKGNYRWWDGTNTGKTGTWSIGKATGSLSISPTTLSLTGSSPTGTISVTRAGDGVISATSSNTSVATVSVSGTTVTVTALAEGSATITVSVAAGTNHNAPSPVTCSVTATDMRKGAYTTALNGISYTNGIASLSRTKLNEIAAAISDNPNINDDTSVIYYDSESDHIKISVGDSVTISFNGESRETLVMGFNHSELASATAYGKTTATGKAGISFQTKDSLNTTAAHHTSNTNTGGWRDSY